MFLFKGYRDPTWIRVAFFYPKNTWANAARELPGRVGRVGQLPCSNVIGLQTRAGRVKKNVVKLYTSGTPDPHSREMKSSPGAKKSGTKKVNFHIQN